MSKIRFFPFVIAFVFLVAVILKIMNPNDFMVQTARMRFVPESIRSELHVIIPLIELAIVVLIVTPKTRQAGTIFGIMLLASFSIFLLLRPKDVGCGCFGAHIDFGLPIVWQNIIGMSINSFILTLGSIWLLWLEKTRKVV